MAFLALDGWVLDVEVGTGGLTPKLVGSTGTALGGRPLNEWRGIDNTWDFKTKPLPFAEAHALLSMLQGQGDHWQWDGASYSSGSLGEGSSEDIWSDKGRGKTDGVSDRWQYRPGIAADGKPIEDSSGNSEALFSNTASLAVEKSATNLFGADTRDAENAPTGYSVVGAASLGSTTAAYVQGTKSVTATLVGAGDGLSATFTSGSTQFSASVCVQTLTSGTTKVALKGSSSGEVASSTVSTDATKWVRVHVTGTLLAGETKTVEVTSPAGSGVQIRADAFQVEVGGYATTWQDNTRVGTGLLEVDTQGLGRAITVAGWFKSPLSSGLGFNYLWALLDSSGDRLIYLRRSTGTDDVTVWVAGPPTATTPSNGAVFDVDSWRHIAVSYSSDSGALKIYVDGVLDKSVTTSVGLVNDIAQLSPGGFNGSTNFNGTIGPLRVMPWEAPLEQIVGWYNESSMIRYPYLQASGTFWPYPGGSIMVEGLDARLKPAPQVLDGTYDESAYRVEFKLRAVGRV